MPYSKIIIPDLLPPSEDGVFKALLTHPEAKPILRDVVESFLKLPVMNVVVRSVETPISDINEKRERFDVNCTADDGSQIDVEMQSDAMAGDNIRTNHKIIKNRAIYYLCDLHSGQPGRGIRFDKLMRSIQITFCGYTVFHGLGDFVSRFSFRDENGIELTDSVVIIFVELTKLIGIINKPVEAMSGEELWSIFFAYGSEPGYKELISKMSSVRREIKMAIDLLQNISKDENERAKFRSRRMFQMDLEHSLAVARDEGLEMGREAGLEIGREEGLKIGLEEGREEGRIKGQEEGRIKGREEGRDEKRKEYESLLSAKDDEIAKLRALLKMQNADKHE